ncbi:hypothetical protein CcaverHIS002_0203870 [Cutaneotrichosporon cavernicola]|uniref:Splicing factor Cactin n=1 Tax=Cutaneotrichosporon cavernicola TaxID=279322 RepID=A0AA48I0S9_9TREE|nr:uncharacterized protein CcaverHIS019_0203830 [Cutaneotrichosporon cavernicola]BEI81227.1 hypothetical protein CcaverHIS002_0203870 [Cutaneotrichosporon cavernicola]BEI89021.1 hypothetical protein CcaverHIS019_0203830 [Cutaneotrichosporon cavernicola]BEI96797.1 hypothetical protein CcaverHIS631_0203860 [Cutaneotrichosporon cavernicola]
MSASPRSDRDDGNTDTPVEQKVNKIEHHDSGSRDERDRKRRRDEDSPRDRERDREPRRDEDSPRDRERDRERRRDRDERDRERRRDRDDRERRERRRDREDDRERRRRKEERREKRRQRESRSRSPARPSATMALHYADTGKFEWHKKKEKEKALGLSPEEVARRDAARRFEAEEELAKLQKKRADREVERALREEEDSRLRRAADDATMAGWVAKEDAFLLEQSRRRAGIRLREQRAKAIDFLAINLRFASAGRSAASMVRDNPRAEEVEREEDEEAWGWADAGFAFEIDEPYRIFDNLSIEECTELEADIAMYRSLERAKTNVAFWDAMAVLCVHHLRELGNPDQAKGGRLHNADVEDAASKIVEGLSFRRLDELEAKTRDMILGVADPEFWRLVLRKIEIQKAIVKLNSVHEIVLKNRLELFRKRQREEAAKAQVDMEESEDEGDLDPEWEGEEEVEEDDAVEAYDPSMSPRPVDIKRLGDDARLPTLTHADYLGALFAARRKVSSETFAPKLPQEEVADTDAATERHWRARIAAESAHLDEDEGLEDMEETDLAEGLPASYDWGDKYRPRKPRYYNRIHTGFEWTSYNKGHYDKENPPPKIVMGYRFHIFYPDLIDKSMPPSYDRVSVPGDDDTELLVFRAGPPYEDVAFRIVRKQWDYSHRRGFRSHFDRGVLQLAFKFQRDTYRK